jgi:hypothetical protein
MRNLVRTAVVLAALARVASAQIAFESVPAASAVRQVLASPAAAGALARNPGLSLVPTLSLQSAPELRALTPLLVRLPPGFSTVAEPAQAAAAVERAYQAAAPAVLTELDAREKELKALPPGPEAADAWRAFAAEAATLKLYGPRAAARVEAAARGAEAAERGALALARAEKTAKSLAPDPDAELERAALEAGRWVPYHDLVDGARASLHATNPPAEMEARLADAQQRGILVSRLASPDGARRLVVDNRLLVEFDAEGRELARLKARRGWILADGGAADRADERALVDSARAFIAGLPDGPRRRAEAELMTKGVERFSLFLAALGAGSLILLHYAPIVVLPLMLWAAMKFLLRYPRWRRLDQIGAAARLGWTRAAAPPPGSVHPWEKILGDLTWEPGRPYHVRLDAAIDALEKASMPAGELSRLLSRLAGPVWSPYLREKHLGFVWRHLSSPDPLAAALAAQFLSGSSAYFLAAHLEARGAEPALLETYERLAPVAARALRAALADRAALG